jgi:type IV pilus assembly protein PilM
MKLLGLDVGASAVKLVELKKTKKGLCLTRARIVEIDTSAYNYTKEVEREEMLREATRNAIETVLKEEKIKKASICTGISGHSLFIRFMKLPRVAERKADQIVRYEAQQQVPFPIDEVVWGYHIFREMDTPEVDVSLIAVKKDIVEGFINNIKDGNLTIEVVDATPISMYNFLTFHNKYEKGTMVLDVGAATTNVIIIDGSKMWTRSIPLAGNDVTESIAHEFELKFNEAEEVKKKEGILLIGEKSGIEVTERAQKLSRTISSVLADLLTEISRSIGFYKSQSPDVVLERIILTGGTSKLKNIDAFFENNIDMKVEKISVLEGMEISPRIQDVGDIENRIEVAMGLGLRCLSAGKIAINLLPQEEQKRLAFNKKKGYIFLSCLISILILLSLRPFILESNRVDEIKLSSLKAQLHEYEDYKMRTDKLKSELKPLEDRFALLDTIMVGKAFWLSTLSELSYVLYPNMWLTSITPQFIPVPLLKIDGKTDGEFKDVEAFQKTLDSSPYFANVVILKAEKIRAKIEDIRTGTRGGVAPYQPIDTRITTGIETEKKDMIEFTIEAKFEKEQADKLAALIPPEAAKEAGTAATPRMMPAMPPGMEEDLMRGRERRR